MRIPDAIAKNVSAYRAIITTEDGIAGEMTFNVVAGELKKIDITPASTQVVKDSSTIATLTLSDANNNPVKSDLYSIELSIDGGSIIDAAENPQKNLKLDIFDSKLSFTIRSENAGQMKIRAKVTSTDSTGNKEFSTEKIIEVIPSAKIKFVFENNDNFIKI